MLTGKVSANQTERGVGVAGGFACKLTFNPFAYRHGVLGMQEY
jgi:hypothetical protein